MNSQTKTNKHVRKERIGKVVSTKMNKTIVVSVSTSYRHPLYKKTVKKDKRFSVHCERDDIVTGDTVKIIEVKPISKNKHFEVVDKVKL